MTLPSTIVKGGHVQASLDFAPDKVAEKAMHIAKQNQIMISNSRSTAQTETANSR